MWYKSLYLIFDNGLSNLIAMDNVLYNLNVIDDVVPDLIAVNIVVSNIIAINCVVSNLFAKDNRASFNLWKKVYSNRKDVMLDHRDLGKWIRNRFEKNL